MNLMVVLVYFAVSYGQAASFDSSSVKSSSSNFDLSERGLGSSSAEDHSSEFLFSGEYDTVDEPKKSLHISYSATGNSDSPFSNVNNPNSTDFDADSKENEENSSSKYDRKESIDEVYRSSKSKISPSINAPTTTKDQISRATVGKTDFRDRSSQTPEYLFKFNGNDREYERREKSISAQPLWKTRNLYPAGSTKKVDDVEVILPQEETLFLPLVNGKPKPYDGYRAPPSEVGKKVAKIKESPERRERRLDQGEIIYGKPRVAIGPTHLLRKRSALEYNGKIQPYYDFKQTWNPLIESSLSDVNLQKRKVDFSDDFFENESNENFFKSFKFQLDEGRKKSKDDHTYYSEESYEASSEENGELEESRDETKKTPAFSNYDHLKVVRSSIQVREPETEIKNTSKALTADERKSEKQDKTLLHTAGTLIGVPETSQESFIEVPVYPKSFEQQNAPILPVERSEANKQNLQEVGNAANAGANRAAGKNSKSSENLENPSLRFTIPFRANENIKRINKRSKRSAKDAVAIAPFIRAETASRHDRISKPKENLRIDYKRPNLFNFRPTNKRFAGNTSSSGYNSYNIYDRPKSSLNWNEAAAKSDFSYNVDGESSKKHEGSFTYKTPEKSYGVPASIYDGVFDFSIEDSETKDKANYQKFSQRYSSNSEYYDEFRTKLSDRQPQSYVSSQGRAFIRPIGNHQRKSKTYGGESTYRPRKYAEDEGFKVDEGKQATKRSEGEERKARAFSASETREADKVDRKDGEVKREDKESCKKEKRGEMLCTVCTNEKTSATYEQCRFSTKSGESEKFYAFERQKSGEPKPILPIFDGRTLEKPVSVLIAKSIFQSPKIERVPAARKPQFSDSIAKQPSTKVGNGKPGDSYIDEDSKRFLRKTERRQVSEDEGEHGEDYEGSHYDVNEGSDEGELTGKGGLTFGAFGDDFGAAFLEFGKHATEDMFHRNSDFSEEEGFGSEDNFDFDSLSFDDFKGGEENANSEEEFSF